MDRSCRRSRARTSTSVPVWLAVALTLPAAVHGCGPGSPPSAPIGDIVPIHLEEHLDAAEIEGAALPAEPAAPVTWQFDGPQPEWLVLQRTHGGARPLTATRVDDALRLTLTEANRAQLAPGRPGVLEGGIFVELPEWNRGDWAEVLVAARTTDPIGEIALGFNVPGGNDDVTTADSGELFAFAGEGVPVIDDGHVQRYRLRADWSWGSWQDPWRQLGLLIRAREPATIEILSVTVVPKEGIYGADRVGVRSEARSDIHRRALFVHAPAKLTFPVRLPAAARLDVAMGVLRDDRPVTFRIEVRAEAAEPVTVLEAAHADKEGWALHQADLARWAGREVLLTLAADTDVAGTVALWGAPTISGADAGRRPNIIFYVIDGAAADFMSVYGYNRRTTPQLERLAAQGAVFERAYSNSTWTKTSTPSFVTSLHHSVLGGYQSDSDPLPDEAVTIAEHLHRAGYQTALMSANPYAGTLSSLERGVDVLKDREGGPNSASSVALQREFFAWRDDFPGSPWWVHFQTTDVHWPHAPQAPFAGVYVSPERRQLFARWERELAAAAGMPAPWWPNRYPAAAFTAAGIDPRAFFEILRGLYDEAMAHNDYQIGQLVRQLQARGEWDDTLLIVAADHGSAHGVRLHRPEQMGRVPMLSSYLTRIPLIFVWPGRIPAGQRFSQPVSMIDLLPTILDIAGQPLPEVMQGQSLAPLLLGREGWQPRPVILDEAYVDAEGRMSATLEVIDGRWGASLTIDPSAEETDPARADLMPALRLFDLLADPYGLDDSAHESHPELTRMYTDLLLAQWEAHLALRQRFSRAGATPLTPEQLATLRALGYIR